MANYYKRLERIKLPGKLREPTPQPEIKGSFPEVFSEYYEQMEKGIRRKDGTLIRKEQESAHEETSRNKELVWLQTGIVLRK